MTARCNPYGYATDAGPRHLMGGMFGPEYAGNQLVNRDGVHGLGICERRPEGRFVMRCSEDHTGPPMDLCPDHVREIKARMSGTCTRCVWPDEARELNEAIDRAMTELTHTADLAAAARLRSRIKDLGLAMDELRARGIIATRPLTLIEVS